MVSIIDDLWPLFFWALTNMEYSTALLAFFIENPLFTEINRHSIKTKEFIDQVSGIYGLSSYGSCWPSSLALP